MLINPAALLALRERTGLSQSELARRAGLAQSHISAIERRARTNDVQPATALALADGLGVPLDAILATTPDGEAEPAAPAEVPA